MPVTARLSRKFYEKLGEDIAQEFVDWFNMVDATYRDDLRETNELNFARFDAKLEQRVAKLDAKLDQRVAELDAKIDKLGTELNAKIDKLRTELDVKIDKLRTELDAKIDQLGTEVNAKIDQLDSTMQTRFAEQTALLVKEIAGVETRMEARNAAARTDLIKWTFVFWATSALVVIGIMTRFL